jgi:hypothetical protein
VISAATIPNEWTYRKPPALVHTGTESRHDIRELALSDDLRGAMPSDSKVAWVVATLSTKHLAEMGAELLRISAHACRRGELQDLAEAIVSWEATAEEIADGRMAGIAGDSTVSEEPVTIEDLRRRLGHQ